MTGPKPNPRDIRLTNMLEDIERNGPKAIEKYPAALRVRLEFGDFLRQLAFLVKSGGIDQMADFYGMLDSQLEQSIERHTRTDIMRAADEARRDERRYWERLRSAPPIDGEDGR